MFSLFFYYVVLPVALVGLNLYFKHLDHKSKVKIEEAKVDAAMRLRAMQEEERRSQHERQLAELRAVAQDKLAKTKPPVQEQKAEPSVPPAAFAQAAQHKVAATPTVVPQPEDLVSSDVFVDREEQTHF